MKKLILVALSLVFAVTTLTACLPFGLATKAPENTSSSTSEGSDASSTNTDTTAPEETEEVKSSASNLTLEFPASWASFDLNDSASIQMGHMTREQYVAVIEDYAKDFSADFNLDQFTQLVIDNYLVSLAIDTAPSVADVQIAGGIVAKQFELSGNVEGINISYLITCFQNEGTYYQALAWSVPSKYDDAKPVFEQILNSAKFQA